MYNKSLFNQFLPDFIQANTNHVRLGITGFIDSFGALIATTDEDIHTFVCDNHSSNSTRDASVRIRFKPRVSNSINAIRFELKGCDFGNALLYEATINAIEMAKMDILRLNPN